MFAKSFVRGSLIAALILSAAGSAQAGEWGGNTEVQVLQAWYGATINGGFGFPGGPQVPSLTVDLAKCALVKASTPLDTGAQGVEVDCAPEIRRLTALKGASTPLAPVLGQLLMRGYRSTQAPSPQPVQSSVFGCATVEIRTVTPADVAASPAFGGIGFFFKNAETFVPKNQLQAVGKTTLKDGRAAIVHRFLGGDLCKTYGGSKYSAQITEFNAYAKIGNDKRWELSGRNHGIGFANGNTTSNGSGWGNSTPIIPPGFDRQGELLKK